MLPRPLALLAMFAMTFAFVSAWRSVGDGIVPYLVSHEEFVIARRHELEQQNALAPPSADVAAVQRAGDALGERAWARRGIHLPLAAANIVLSAVFFLGALRALRRSRWGHGAWTFAARVKVPWVLAATAVAWVEAGDRYAASLVVNGPRSLLTSVPVETLAHLEVSWTRALHCAGAALAIGFYLTCAIWLARPKVKSLFSE